MGKPFRMVEIGGQPGGWRHPGHANPHCDLRSEVTACRLGRAGDMSRPRVLLADDHLMVAEGLRSLLESDFDLVGTVEDGHALIAAVEELRPDVVVADITMPKLNGLDAAVRLRKTHPRVKVVFLTMHHDPAYARRALEAGAWGFVLKHSAPAELVMAINAALSGQVFITPAIAGEVVRALRMSPDGAGDPIDMLTPRQREILQLLVEGLSAKEIAATLGISPRTVEFHKYQMMETLDIRTSAALIHFAVRHGLVAK